MRATISRFLKIALGVTGLISAAVFAIPNLVSIGMFFLIIPGLILAITPTIFLHLSLFSVPWFTISRRSVPLAIAGGLGFLWLFGFYVPTLLNRWTDGYLREAQAKELPLGSEVRLAGVVGLQAGLKRSMTGCGDLCQTLLYDARVERIVLLPLEKGTGVSFRIERQANCPETDPKIMSREFSGQWLKGEDSSRVEAATRLRIAGGECLVKEAWSQNPDWTIARVSEDFGARPSYLSLLPGEAHAEGLQVLERDRLVKRESRILARRLRTPLHLTPRSGSDLNIRGWEWGRASDRQEPVDARRFLTGSATSSDVPGVVPSNPDEVRRALDAALDNPDATTAAFAVVDDYYRMFGYPDRVKFRSEDSRRLVRLIADPRVTSFWTVPLSSIPLRTEQLLLRDPILDRMTKLAQQDKWDSYRALDALAGRLPRGAFEKPDPRIDAIIADPDLRRAAPALVTRLSDQGPSAAGSLLTISTQGWGPRRSATRRNPPGNQGDDPRAAVNGLCRLGTGASFLLPQLRQAAADGSIPSSFQQSDAWRAMMIALGVSSNEFALPANTVGKLDSYRQKLEKKARDCGRPQ